MSKIKVFRDNKSQMRAEDGDSRHVSGYACVFGERSVLMLDWEHGPVYEVIEPGAITDDLLRSSDVIACIEHDSDRMLARSVNGEGTLSLALDEHGLQCGWDCLNTTDGFNCLENVRAGNYRGMSFGFWINPDTDVSYTAEKEDGKDIKVRHINHVQGVFDVSVVAHPSYPATDIQQRSADFTKALEAELRKAFPEQPKKEERSKEMMRDWDFIEQLKHRNW